MSEEKLVHDSVKFGVINLMTLEGVQTGLKHLGYDPGTIDGFDGPRTQNAVREFQKASQIGADGAVGPITRATLYQALNVAAG